MMNLLNSELKGLLKAFIIHTLAVGVVLLVFGFVNGMAVYGCYMLFWHFVGIILTTNAYVEMNKPTEEEDEHGQI